METSIVWDVFLAYTHADQPFAARLTEVFRARALEVGQPIELWGGERLLSLLDQGLYDSQYAIVIISRDFLHLDWQAKVLEGLAHRRRVIGLLWGVDESDVALHSRGLAVSAMPGSMAEDLVRMVRRARV
jgi:hypothetical protein